MVIRGKLVTPQYFFRFVVCAAFVLFAAVCSGATPTFQHDILPLLEKKCLACHSQGDRSMAGLDLQTLAAVMAGGTAGPVVVPGNPEDSRFWVMVRDGKMPMGGEPLSDEEKQLVRTWIEQGQFPTRDEALAEKRASKITEEARQWWAFQKPVNFPVPKVRDAARVKTPIDAFLLEKLEAKRWTFGPAADKRTLIRRAYLDLVGFPPSLEEVEAFLADSKPGAYERLIDKLLASPHYGERWGRHWLDVVGYSDSIGNSTDEVRTLAWRYRDYVIRAFNSDKPYNEFLLEQFAGDQIVNQNPDAKPKPEDIEKLTATGFLRVGPDYGDQQPIYQVDKYYDALQATAEISLKAVMGLQFACAKCHDHKFDPILQEDYYKLIAAFEPALDPEKWIPATSFSYGTWPSRHLLNLEPEEREEWVKAIQEAYRKVRRERGAVNAAFQKARKELRGDAAGASTEDSTDVANDSELETRYPELRKRAEELRQWEDTYRQLDQKRIWGLWDVSKDPSPTHVLLRGNYLSPGPEVGPGIPAVLDDPDHPYQFPVPKEEWHHTGRRLALAQWLTRPDHPLTGRVVVNRIWQYHFGDGIVPTPDDFGSQGFPPTHPELLDWLATNFVENGWSFKWLHKQIMLSSAYRQSSVEDAEKLQEDPSNKLLWRKSPLRLEAEVIRDAIIEVSGGLDRTLYGEFIPLKKGADGQFVVDETGHEGARKRRSIYLLNRKTGPHGFLLAFDAPTMDAGSMAVRFRSALPAQSLAMMNNNFVIESAKDLAARLEADAGPDWESRARRVYELLFSRPPRSGELKLIRRALKGSNGDQSDWFVICQALLGSNEFLYSY